ncbi:MAG: hypothetical protein H0X25_07260 [Acidobacteriales bacterium]|nr:hypothetical protein [Terriglobales bacterium]
MTALSGWQNFYVIVGSSAGALIGLQFVVITLVAELPVKNDLEQAGSAFATPTIVHFGAVLLLAAVISAPWHGTAAPAMIWGVVGLAGVGYELITVRRMRMQKAYSPEWEDWLFHVVLPFAAYAILAGAAYAVRFHPPRALFGVAAATLLLLFSGIHNAWDAVTYHIFVLRRKTQNRDRR